MARTVAAQLWKGQNKQLLPDVKKFKDFDFGFFSTSKLLGLTSWWANLTLLLAIPQVQLRGHNSTVFSVKLRKERSVRGIPSFSISPSPPWYQASLADSLSWTPQSVLLASCHAFAQCFSNNQDIRTPNVKETSAEVAKEVFEGCNTSEVFFLLGSGAMQGQLAPPRWRLITLGGGSRSQPGPVVPSTWRWVSIGKPPSFRPAKLQLVILSLLTESPQIPRDSNQSGESSSGPRVES